MMELETWCWTQTSRSRAVFTLIANLLSLPLVAQMAHLFWGLALGGIRDFKICKMRESRMATFVLRTGTCQWKF